MKIGRTETDNDTKSLIPAGNEVLVRASHQISNFHSKAESIAATVLSVSFSILKAFSGPVGSIIGDIAGKIEADRLVAQLDFLQARLASLEADDLKRAKSEEAKPLLKEALRLGVQEPDDRKRNLYVDAFANAIRSGEALSNHDFRGLRVLGEMSQRHLDILNQIRRKARDEAGRISFEHGEVEYGWNGNKLDELQDLQGWGVLLPYGPDTSRQRWLVTGFGSHLLQLFCHREDPPADRV